MDTLASVLLLTLILVAVALMAAIVGRESRDDYTDATYWRTFGPRF